MKHALAVATLAATLLLSGCATVEYAEVKTAWVTKESKATLVLYSETPQWCWVEVSDPKGKLLSKTRTHIDHEPSIVSSSDVGPPPSGFRIALRTKNGDQFFTVP